MKGNIVSKILICIPIAAFLGMIGFIGMVFMSLTGYAKFYAPLVGIVTAGCFILIVIKIFGWLKPKTFRYVFIGFVLICGLAVGGYEANQAYQNSFIKVNEQGVDLEAYRPFASNSKAVKLAEESTLKITSDLPRMDGATALYPLYAAFAQAVYPEKEYPLYNSAVQCSNTVGSYENLIKGEADIVFAARPSKQQLEEAAAAGVELKLTPIGREAFVFFVNARNEVDNLTTAQIQDIYSGKITNWSEVGGKNEKIRAFQRPENSGSQTMLQKLMEGKTLMAPPKEDVVAGMGGIIEQTASYRNYKNAIGYSFRFFATEMVKNNEIRLLKVDGIYPDRASIENKHYPLSAEFYAVTAGRSNPHLEALIQWILSPQGQSLIDKTGYTPIRE